MDLELVDTARILHELSRRFDAMVFSGAKGRTEKEEEVLHCSHGDLIASLGLCTVMTYRLNQELQSRSEDAR